MHSGDVQAVPENAGWIYLEATKLGSTPGKPGSPPATASATCGEFLELSIIGQGLTLAPELVTGIKAMTFAVVALGHVGNWPDNQLEDFVMITGFDAQSGLIALLTARLSMQKGAPKPLPGSQARYIHYSGSGKTFCANTKRSRDRADRRSGVISARQQRIQRKAANRNT
jgi:hypothetical protein